MGILDRMKLKELDSFLDETRNRDEAIREAVRHEEAIFHRLGRGPFSLEELLLANRELRNRVDNRFPPSRGEAPAPKLPAPLARQFERLSDDIVRDVKSGKLPLGHAEDFQKSFFEQLGP